MVDGGFGDGRREAPLDAGGPAGFEKRQGQHRRL